MLKIPQMSYFGKRLLSTKPVFITTPIFYVNAEPHIGHLYSIVVGDTLARWHRMLGRKTYYVSGTDEHGLKIQVSADKQRMAPQAFCDSVSAKFRLLVDKSNSQVDDFIRTTEPRHVRAVTEMWRRLEERGFIYKGTHEGWYSTSDESFFAEMQTTTNAKGERVAVETGNVVEWVSEENYKFALSKCHRMVAEWVESSRSIFPKSKVNFVLNMVNNEMQDLSVSRLASKVKWGIPVPHDPKHTIYVWLDALTNYLTVTGFPWADPSDADKLWPADFHIVGKDIIKFHAIYWPAFLMAAGLPPPKTILSHGHWTIEGEKMSKSKGNVVNPFEAIERHGADPLRYYLLRYGSLTDDGGYSDEMVAQRRTADLGNNLGNLVSRMTSPSLNPLQQWPRAVAYSPEDAALVALVSKIPATVRDSFDQLEFQKGLNAIFEALGEVNKHVNAVQPWTMAKGKPREDLAKLDTTTFIVLESIRLCGLLLQPVMPGVMKELLDRLGVPAERRSFQDAVWGQSPLGATVSHSILFPRPPKEKARETTVEQKLK